MEQGNGQEIENQKLWGDHYKVKFKLASQEEIGNLLDLAPATIKTMKKWGSRRAEHRPTVAHQVLVQSALEKELTKQQRKEEKKMQRLMQSIGRNEKDEDEVAQVINPMQLRLQQQRKLLEHAQHQPISKMQSTIKRIPFYTCCSATLSLCFR
ncbi:hypothetical protein CVS40_4990 [Lucilia cuprina]|nr:hypothetical protein CVS40_4990 [Lucilia cuprina]